MTSLYCGHLFIQAVFSCINLICLQQTFYQKSSVTRWGAVPFKVTFFPLFFSTESKTSYGFRILHSLQKRLRFYSFLCSNFEEQGPGHFLVRVAGSEDIVVHIFRKSVGWIFQHFERHAKTDIFLLPSRYFHCPFVSLPFVGCFFNEGIDAENLHILLSLESCCCSCLYFNFLCILILLLNVAYQPCFGSFSESMLSQACHYEFKLLQLF